MADLSDKQKMDIATRAADTMLITLSAVPEQIRLEASIMLLRHLFATLVRPEKRISMFRAVMHRMKVELKT